MNRADIQGLLFSGYSAQPASAVIFVRFADGRPHAWLRRMLPQVSSGASSERTDPFRNNLAFTFAGLEKLGLPAETLRGFSEEFRQGMAHPERAAALGDSGPNHPSTWQFADRGPEAVHGVVLLYASSAAALGEKLEQEQQALARFGLSFEVLRTYLPSDQRTHFGFRMGASQPFVRGLHHGRARRPRLATGEFLIGYPDGVGDCAHGPRAPWRRSTREPLERSDRPRQLRFGFNGSYLVLRKLEQRVEAFQALLARAENAGLASELCAAKLVGRWPNGAALVLHPEREPAWLEREPRLSYDELDPRGQRCPIGAHARRANPSEGAAKGEPQNDRHRLIRRGRLYGPLREERQESADERGLLFLALNADLGRQFEHVRGQRLASGTLPGLRGEVDPLLGVASISDPVARHFTVPADPVRMRVPGLPDLVRARGGLYAFLPSLRALGYLADLGGPGPSREHVAP